MVTEITSASFLTKPWQNTLDRSLIVNQADFPHNNLNAIITLNK